jgi:hypothetical protein
VTGLARATRATLQRYVRELAYENRQLRRQCAQIFGPVIPLTIDHDTPAGTTIMVRIPTRFRGRMAPPTVHETFNRPLADLPASLRQSIRR